MEEMMVVAYGLRLNVLVLTVIATRPIAVSGSSQGNRRLQNRALGDKIPASYQ
jgi:hypothetical protein